MYRDDCGYCLDSQFDVDTRHCWYYKGHCKVMCVSPQMLPDPDCKAEDQRGARARASAGNNKDDDNQGGDMPIWMFKEEFNREETKNRALKRCQSPRGHHGRKVFCWTSFDKGSGKEE